ncbi:hypothetical protein Tco_0002138 [Tanacetum coccineum]
MFYSLIMFVVILLPSVYGVSYASQEYGIALVSVSASLICLLCYFCHCFDTRIQKRRLEYAEVEQKVEMHVPFYDVQALILLFFAYEAKSVLRDLFAKVIRGSGIVAVDELSLFVECVSDFWRGIAEMIVCATSSMMSCGGVPVESIIYS